MDVAYPGHRFHYVMQRIVVAARAAGVRALDGSMALSPTTATRRDCGRTVSWLVL